MVSSEHKALPSPKLRVGPSAPQSMPQVQLTFALGRPPVARHDGVSQLAQVEVSGLFALLAGEQMLRLRRRTPQHPRRELRVALREWHRRIPEYTIKSGHEELVYLPGLRSVRDLMLVWPH